MKEISKESLEKWQADYDQDKLQKVVRQFLFDNDLSKSAKLHYEMQDQFSINIPTLPVTNQMASGRCWLFAGLNVLREEVAKKLNLSEFELSQNYVAFYDKLEKINFTLESLIALKDRPWDDRTLSWVLETGIQDGGQWDMFVAIVKKYGVVPKSAMIESYQSSHTAMMNSLINRTLRRFAYDIRKLDEDAIKAHKEEVLEKLYGMLCTCFGVPPKTFDFEYVDKDKNYHKLTGLDPLGFYKEYVGLDLDDYVSIINSPTSDKPFYKTFTVDYLGNVLGKKVRYLNLPLSEFKKTIIAKMKNGEIVWFGSDCGKFGERNKGYWDPAAFDYDTLFDIDFSISKEAALMFRDSAMNHAMVFTGVNLEGEKSTKWRIENSWGDDKAHKGYYVASDLWFDAYVYQAVVDKKYLSPEAIEALAEDDIHLNPWDPMGTLAD